MGYQVSVIIPVYKVEGYIERCARSLFGQTFGSIEYIFVDDCTPDRSMQIVERIVSGYSGRFGDIRYVRHAANKGVSAVRNSGLSAATGKYICYCDSDDWVEADMIEKMYDTAIRTQADLVWTDFYYSCSSHEELISQRTQPDRMECIKALLSEELHGSMVNKLVKRDLYIKNNVCFLENLNMWEDLRVMVQLFFYARSIAYLPKAFYHYVHYNTNSLCANYTVKRINETTGNAESIIQFLADNGVRQKLDRHINYLKLAAKKSLLFATNKNSFLRWRELYPESNKYIWSYSALPLHLRLIGWCTSNGMWPVIHLWIYFKKLKNKR